jgi:hypothetical protein
LSATVSDRLQLGQTKVIGMVGAVRDLVMSGHRPLYHPAQASR